MVHITSYLFCLSASFQLFLLIAAESNLDKYDLDRKPRDESYTHYDNKYRNNLLKDYNIAGTHTRDKSFPILSEIKSADTFLAPSLYHKELPQSSSSLSGTVRRWWQAIGVRWSAIFIIKEITDTTSNWFTNYNSC